MRLRLTFLSVCLTLAVPLRAQVFLDDRPRTPPSLGGAVDGVAVDVDGDGRVDLVRVGERGVAVLRGLPTGRFDAPLPLPIAPANVATAVRIAIGTLTTGDGYPDVVVLPASGQPQLLENRGPSQWSWRTPSPFTRAPSAPFTDVVVADFDRRAGDDVLFLTDGGTPQLWLADGNGGFREGTSAAFQGIASLGARGIAADLDGDGAPELIFGATANLPPLLLRNDGAGRFVADAQTFAGVTAGGHAVVAADLDGDAAIDVALTATLAAPAVVVFRNVGGGRLQRVATTGTFALGPAAELFVADLDGDGRPELIGCAGSGVIRIGANLGGLQFAASAATPELDLGARRVVRAADLDGDGDADLWAAGADGGDRIVLGDGRGGLRVLEPTLRGGFPRISVAVVHDVDRDGDPDVVAFDAGGAACEMRNDGSGRLHATSTAGVVPGARYDELHRAPVRSPTARDFVLLANATGVRIVVDDPFVGLRDETGMRWPSPAPQGLVAAAVADFFGGQPTTDGHADVVAADAAGQLRTFVNHGGVFAPGVVVAGLSLLGVVKLMPARIDGDSEVDVVAFLAGAAPRVFVQGSGTFVEVAGAVVAPGVRDGLVLDLDGDGFDDLVVATSEVTPRILVLRNAGNGTFVDATASWLPAGAPAGNTLGWLPRAGVRVDRASGILIGGVDGDVFHLPRAGMLFAAAQPLPLRSLYRSPEFVVGDFDGGGDADLLVHGRDGAAELLANAGVRLTLVAAPVQAGSPFELRLRGPPGGLTALYVAPATARIPFEPFGVFRLLQPIPLLTAALPPSGRLDLLVPSSRSWPAVTLPMQSLMLDVSTARATLTNLELVEIVR